MQVAICVLIQWLLVPLWATGHPLVLLDDRVERAEFQTAADGGWAADAKSRVGLSGSPVLDGCSRKTLGWKIPAEALDELLLIQQPGSVATTG